MSRIDEALGRVQGAGPVPETDPRRAAPPAPPSVPAPEPMFPLDETVAPLDELSSAHEAPSTPTFAPEERVSSEFREAPPAPSLHHTQGTPATGNGHQAWLERLVTHADANPSMIDQFRKLAAALH